VPPIRCKRPVSPSEYTPSELEDVDEFERRWHRQEESESSSSDSSSASSSSSAKSPSETPHSTGDSAKSKTPKATSRPLPPDAIPRLTPEKRRTIQLKKARQGLGAQAAELKAIRKKTNRVGNRRCRVCKLTCNSASALKHHLESSKHKRHAEEQNRRQEGPPHCKECDRDFNTYSDLESHIRGKYHIRHINFLASHGKL
jgi:Zinc finger, C2H2 type/Zinc-finger of C2H2 type